MDNFQDCSPTYIPLIERNKDRAYQYLFNEHHLFGNTITSTAAKFSQLVRHFFFLKREKNKKLYENQDLIFFMQDFLNSQKL